MGDDYEISFKIESVSLEVKFSCSLYLERDGIRITDKAISNQGRFIIAQTIRIATKSSKEQGSWEANLFLESSRGTKYPCGVISLPFLKLSQANLRQSFSVPLERCSDKNSKAVIQVMQIKKLQIESRSQYRIKIDSIDKKGLSLNENGEKEQTGRFNAQPSLPSLTSLGDELEPHQLKIRVEELQKIISSNKLAIYGLEKKATQSKEYIKTLKDSENYLKNQIGEREKLIAELLQKNKELTSQIQLLTEQNREQEDHLKNIAQQQMDQMAQLQIETEEKLYEEVEALEQKVHELEEDNTLKQEQNRILLAEMEELQAGWDEKFEKQLQKVKELEEIAHQHQKLIEKLKKIENALNFATKEKEDLLTANSKLKKQVEALEGNKLKLYETEQQLMILKKKSHDREQTRDRLVQDIANDLQNELKTLLEQRESCQEELKRTKDENKALSDKIGLLKVQLQKEQSQKRHLNQLNDAIRLELGKKQQLLKQNNLKLEQAVEANKQLNERNKTLKQELESERNIVVELTKKNSELAVELESDEKLIAQLKFEQEKNMLENQLSSSESQNVHAQCKAIQARQEQKINASLDRIQSIQSQLISTKSQKKDIQARLHQTSLQLSLANEELLKVGKTATKAERIAQQLDHQLKQKQIALAEATEDREKYMQSMKEAERKMLQAIEGYHTAVEQRRRAENKEYRLETRIKELEEEITCNRGLIDRLQESQIDLNRKVKMNEEKILVTQHEMKAALREVERVRQKNLKLVSKLVELPEGCDAVETLIKHHHQTVSRFESQLNAISQEVGQLNIDLGDRNSQIENLNEENIFLDELNKRSKDDMEKLEIAIELKDSQLESLNSEHNELLSIHEEYIFTFNRYKIDKENELKDYENRMIECRTSIHSLEQELSNEKNHKIQATRQNQRIQQDKDNLLRANSTMKNDIQRLQKYVMELQASERNEKAKNIKVSSEIKFISEEKRDLSEQISLLNEKLEKAGEQLRQSQDMVMQMMKSKEKFVKKQLKDSETIHSLQLSVQNLQMTLQGLQTDKDNLEAEAKSLKQKNKDLTKQSKSLASTIEDLEEAQRKTLQKLNDKDSKYQQLHSKLASNDTTIELLEQSHRQKILLLETTIQNLQKDLYRSRESEESFKSTSYSEFEDLQTKLEKSLEQKIQLQAQLQLVSKKLDEKSTSIDLLTKDVKRLEGDLTEAELKIVQLYKQLKEKEESLFEMNGKVHQIEMAYESEDRKTRISVEANERAWFERIDALQQEIETVTIESNRVQADLLFQNEQLRQQVVTKERMRQEAQEQMFDLEMSQQVKKNAFELELANVSKLNQSKIEQFQREITTKDSLLRDCKKEMQELKQKGSELLLSVQKLKQENEELKKQIKDHDVMIQNLKQQKTDSEREERKRLEADKERAWQLTRQVKKQFYQTSKNISETVSRSEFIEVSRELEDKIMALINPKA